MSTDDCGHGRTMLSWAAVDLQAQTRGPQKPLQHLAAMSRVEHRLSTARPLFVSGARDMGASWAEIAQVLGISRQAVWSAYAEPDPLRNHWLTRQEFIYYREHGGAPS